ncbi:unnamed protein product [Hydatigera taeniaeformis]|uniref:HTH La-type RNA-binding domain-containing protein n=1 Tax=Hydatigena taeniaeformis TaxID=6205 RepID=A0A0R3XBU3_HYDTA|nr:unnamed protein product [Hydatigera taeniaeformis]
MSKKEVPVGSSGRGCGTTGLGGCETQLTSNGKRDCPWSYNPTTSTLSEVHTGMSDRDWPSLQIHHDGSMVPQSNGAKPTAKVKPTNPSTQTTTVKNSNDRRSSFTRQKNRWTTVALDYTYSKDIGGDQRVGGAGKSNKAFGYPVVMIYATPENCIGLEHCSPLVTSAPPDSTDQSLLTSLPSPGAISLPNWIPTTQDPAKTNETASVPLGSSPASLFFRPGVFHFDPSIPLLDSDAILQSRILHQIEFYFSEDNLVRDTFLRSHMDEDGWVPISVIAKFNRVALLCTDLEKIINALVPSQIIETDTKGMRVRCRNRPTQWVIRSFLRVAGGHTREADSADEPEAGGSLTSETRPTIPPPNPEVMDLMPSIGKRVPTKRCTITLIIYLYSLLNLEFLLQLWLSSFY